MYYLGTALYGLGDYRKAESLLIKALARDDPMPEAHLTLINLYVKQKRYDAAIEQIEAFLKINPDASIKEQLEKTIQQIKKEKSTK
jgi:tetratricopeptide (TPR) repeat protein